MSSVIDFKGKKTISLECLIEDLIILKREIEARGANAKNIPVFARKNITDDFDDFKGIDLLSIGMIDDLKNNGYMALTES